jgi:hypothetical protein
MAKASHTQGLITIGMDLGDKNSPLLCAGPRMAKSLGERIPICDADQMGVEKTESLPAQIVIMRKYL